MKGEKLNIVILVFLCLILFKTCTLSTSKVNKKLVQIEHKIDSLEKVIVTKTDIKVEGLKNEKRFIQATDRKLLDVQRQSDIDKELIELINNTKK